MTSEFIIQIGLLIAVAWIAYFTGEALRMIRRLSVGITIDGFTQNLTVLLSRPPAPPKPLLLKERVYQTMSKIYLPFLLPEVPFLGTPVKRIVTVSYNGEIVKTFDDAPLTKCRLDLWPDAGVLVTVATYTKDAAGNVSEASVVSYTAEDVYPPPAPPQPELLIDECDEVEYDKVGEIDIVPIE